MNVCNATKSGCVRASYDNTEDQYVSANCGAIGVIVMEANNSSNDSEANSVNQNNKAKRPEQMLDKGRVQSLEI